MEFLNNISLETIIICSNNYKKYLLSLNKLVNIKLYTLEEFKKLFYFDYDEKTIMYIVRKYNVKYEIAKNYLDNLYYLDKDDYGVKKLSFLVNLREDLLENNLLLFNSYFKEYLIGKEIYIFEEMDELYISRMLSGYNYHFVYRDYKSYKHDIYEFASMEEEVEYIANKICSLIDSGISIDKIKLMNVDSSYLATIRRIFRNFNLKINDVFQTKLISYKEVRDFLINYRNHNLEDALSNLDMNFLYYDNLIDIINKYLKYDDKELLIYKIENSKISSLEYNNTIEIVDYLEYITKEDEYVFLVGYNNGKIPNYYKDTSYISDNIANLVNKTDTRSLNNKLREKIILSLGDIKNLTITYKLRDFKNKYTISNLLENPNIIKPSIDYTTYYSKIYHELKLGKVYDNYLKFGVKDELYDLLNDNYQIDYNSYKNDFTGINSSFDNLILSYTKMQLYNKCAFRYYLTDVLKLDIYLENFSTIIGEMVHYVMERCLSNNDMDSDKYFLEYLNKDKFKDKIFNNKELFFLNRYKLLIKELLNETILEKNYMSFDKAMYEKEVLVNLEDNVLFKGVIDKILYYIDNNKTYLALIDYKTGNDTISLKNMKYGLDMQLPIYLYLAQKLDFKNPIYTGFYLQKFNIIERDYRLIGYSNSDKDILRIIDNEYDNSKIIKSLKTLKDGRFASYSKVLSNEEIDEIISLAHLKITETINNIKKNQFMINPKVIDNQNIGCMYCKFRDICYVNEKNKVILEDKDGSDE